MRSRAAHVAAFLLAGPVAFYIRVQHDRLAKGAVGLPPRFKDEFTPYFGQDLLGSARLFASESLRFPAVPFEKALRGCGVSIPSAQRVAAMTFDNLVAVREVPSSNLMFHELVHVAQFRQLGTSAFARLYVRGFLAEGRYDRIPLERCASMLEQRFLWDSVPFSVEAAVRWWIEHDLF